MFANKTGFLKSRVIRRLLGIDFSKIVNKVQDLLPSISMQNAGFLKGGLQTIAEKKWKVSDLELREGNVIISEEKENRDRVKTETHTCISAGKYFDTLFKLSDIEKEQMLIDAGLSIHTSSQKEENAYVIKEQNEKSAFPKYTLYVRGGKYSLRLSSQDDEKESKEIKVKITETTKTETSITKTEILCNSKESLKGVIDKLQGGTSLKEIEESSKGT